MICASVDQLIQMQLELQSIRVTYEHSSVCIPGLYPEEIGRVFIARYDGGRLVSVPHELPSPIRDCLEEFAPDIASADLLGITHLIAQQITDSHIRCWRTCIFAGALTPADYPDVVPLRAGRPAFAGQSDLEMEYGGHTEFGIVVGGQVISACRSVRENARAAEAWVCTLPAYCKRGYARQVTAAWGDSLQKRRKVAFYSHVPENRAAQALADSLGLVHVFDLIEWDLMTLPASP